MSSFSARSPDERLSGPPVEAPAGSPASEPATFVGRSPAFRDAVMLTRLVAVRPLTTVLLVGETGTGKELFVRGIHTMGPSAAEPFVAVNCSAIPESLFESELFGHEPGAFTGARAVKPGLFECAAGGTLFLDEIGDMPRHMQPKLLRVVEDRMFRRVGGTVEHPVRCRIVAGTNAMLEDAVAQGTFREDLFYRLNVFRIDLPPLRSRPEDVVPLAEHFLRRVAADTGEPRKCLDASARRRLEQHAWPGNVRELRNVIERACILAAGPVITAAELRLQYDEGVGAQACAADTIGTIAIPRSGKSLAAVELEAIRLTLTLTAGNVSAASRLLGISRPTLMRKLHEGDAGAGALTAS